MSLPDALEAAATALPAEADLIRPANGDPIRLLEVLTPEASVRVLAWLFENQPKDGEELALDWEADDRGAKLLSGLEESALPKAGKKALRKMKHRLRSRGEVVPEAPVAPKVAALGSVDEDVRGSWLTPIDPTGARMAVVAEPNPGRGSRLFEVILDDARGIVSFEVYTASRGKVRRFVKAMTEKGDNPAVEVEHDALQAVVARALAAQPSDRTVPKGFGEWRSRLASPPEGTKLPSDEVRAALGEGDGASLDDAIELLEKNRVGPWPVSRETLTELLEKVREALESPLIVSGGAKSDQIDGILKEGAGEIYQGEVAEVAAHRFRESAYLFWKGEDEAAAKACLAAATALDAGNGSENPVAVAMLRIPLAPAIAQVETQAALAAAEGADDAEDEPKIVTP